MARLVDEQLTRFATLNPYRLAGRMENLDFWLEEIRHALAVIDGYGVRFIRLQAAEKPYIVTKQITASVIDPSGVPHVFHHKYAKPRIVNCSTHARHPSKRRNDSWLGARQRA